MTTVEPAGQPLAAVRESGAGRRAHSIGPPLAVVFLLLVGVVALFPDLVGGNPEAVDPADAFLDPSAEHLFGTDQLGRDVLTRVVHGAGASLALGLGATALAAVVGIVWGLAAGLGGRFVDEAAMRLADILLSVPTILLALLVVAVLGPGGPSVAIAIAVSLSPGFARVVRVQTLVVDRTGYVQSATALGLRRRSVVGRHIVPNVLPPMLVLATMNIGASIIAGASLSFLGLGPEASSSEWGSLLSQARNYLQDAWAPAVFPGLAVVLTVISISVIGRELRIRFEGRYDR
ncbi:ABC transporter permease [Pseudonocardia ailaonensis]|uniref:ABC transporter permease n=1 Tax=Pseudonocardia ailaonensis TaxID=367279 RepID=A0ABN2MV45_9PSEU